MSKQSKEPAGKPAPIPPLKNIISEGSREIGAQARAAVETILAKGDFASPAQLSKWGPSGAKYFFKVLQQPAQAAVDPQPCAEGGAERGRVVTPRHKGPPVTTDRDWIAQQYNRWPTRTRAIVHGMLVAVALLAGAGMVVRLWTSLVAAAQQQIQNWS